MFLYQNGAKFRLAKKGREMGKKTNILFLTQLIYFLMVIKDQFHVAKRVALITVVSPKVQVL